MEIGRIDFHESIIKLSYRIRGREVRVIRNKSKNIMAGIQNDA